MELIGPDLLYPLRDKNRDEIFLVEYDGFIKNLTESIVIAMLLTKQKWIDKYPRLDKYTSLTDGELYDDISLYSPEECLRRLSNDTVNIEDIMKDIDELSIVDTLSYQSNTVFEFVLYNLLKEKFVKECYFIKTTPFQEYELEYLSHSYLSNIKKINPVSGDLKEAFIEFNPTTCFFNDINNITDIIKTVDSDKIKNKLFVLRNTSKTVFYDDSDKLFHYYPEVTSIINEASNSKKYLIGPMYAFRQTMTELQDPVG